MAGAVPHERRPRSPGTFSCVQGVFEYAPSVVSTVIPCLFGPRPGADYTAVQEHAARPCHGSGVGDGSLRGVVAGSSSRAQPPVDQGARRQHRWRCSLIAHSCSEKPCSLARLSVAVVAFTSMAHAAGNDSLEKTSLTNRTARTGSPTDALTASSTSGPLAQIHAGSVDRLEGLAWSIDLPDVHGGSTTPALRWMGSSTSPSIKVSCMRWRRAAEQASVEVRPAGVEGRGQEVPPPPGAARHRLLARTRSASWRHSKRSAHCTGCRLGRRRLWSEQTGAPG